MRIVAITHIAIPKNFMAMAVNRYKMSFETQTLAFLVGQMQFILASIFNNSSPDLNSDLNTLKKLKNEMCMNVYEYNINIWQ